MKFLLKNWMALNPKLLMVNKHSFDKNELPSGIEVKMRPEENLF